MLKYQKGTFVVVPNIDRLDVLPALAQALFIWVCKYANEDGTCFPSRKKLAGHLSCTMKTIDKNMGFLVDLGFITKTNRKKKGTKEMMSNLYQILLVGVENVVPDPSVNNDPTPREVNDPVTISNINSINLTKLPAAELPDKPPFVFIEKLEELRVSNKKIDKIIHLYFKRKNFYFDNQEQFNTEFRINLKRAKDLSGYSSEQIWETFDYCDREMKNIPWNLGTVVKVISNVVNQK